MSDDFKNSGCSPSDCATCGGGCNIKPGQEDGPRTITLTMDDDTEVECAILTIFSVDEHEYIALLPLDENGQNHDGEVYLYTFSTMEDGSPMLSNVEDDDDYEKAANEFNRIMESARLEEASGVPLDEE